MGFDRRDFNFDGIDSNRFFRLVKDVDHLLDRSDSSNRFFGEWKRKGYGSNHFAINIDWTSAHPTHDPGVLERSARQTGQDCALLGGDVLKHSQDLNLEFFHFVAVKNGSSNSFQTGLHLAQRQEILLAICGLGASPPKK